MPTNEASAGDKPAERVFLIDSMSHIFRAFFAPMSNRVAPLSNSSGQVTQAVYIFTNMLRKLLQDEKPNYIAAIFESKEKTFRHETFAGYKANRLAMPEDLASQIPYILRLCEALNIPVINAPGFEADDVIGTLAKKITAQKLQAVIVSNDKDMCQLVSDPYVICMRTNSQVVKRKEFVPPIEWCDEAWVEKKFGVPASKVVDLLGLMGDSIDNIPGAPGIGAKGAVQVITQFGSIEEALNRWEEVKHKTYRESLRDNADLIRQSRELARIRLDVEVELDLDQIKARDPDRAAAYELFKELEFSALTREFADAALAASVGSGDKLNYKIIDSRAALDGLIQSLWDAESVGVSIADATPSNQPFDKDESDERPVDQQCVMDYEAAEGISFSTAEGQAAFVDFNKFTEGRESVLASLREVLSNGLIEKSVHDLKRTIGLLGRLDITIEGVKDDTLLAAYLLDPNRSKYELSDLAREAVNVERIEKPATGWTDMQWETAANADLTARTAKVLHQRILEKKLETIYSEMELPLAPLLYRMERSGLKVDRVVLSDLSNYLGLELKKLTVKIYELAGREFNIGSPKQVGEVLSDLEMTSGRKTSTGRISTSKAVLEELAQTFELPRMIIDYRELDKLKSVYTDALPHQIAADGRIHCLLNQTVAATGRLSSSDPNLQNIPIRTELGRRIRRSFVAEKGYKIISADYSQLELRLLAHITQDPVMLEAFQNGEDIHARTARLVFGAQTDEELKEARRFAKIVNFAIAYAIEPWGLSQRVGISRPEAKKVIDDYYNTYKGVRRYMEEVPLRAREHGYVRSIYGRMRPLPGISDRNANIRKAAEREAINMPIQGTASDIVKIAMLRVDEEFKREGLDARLLMQVHDELLVETPTAGAEHVAAVLKREMEGAVSLDVPLIVDVGIADNWMDAKP
ncbi:MAG TPA: DNA polymerase I [Pyrinomonadaceae bacterium]|jgi:DNA polymerase-1|nr:DNA polymerase I [Pyrinomonadaceae bacterium]